MFKYLTLLCFSIAVGRNASECGSVLLGHNEDDYNVTEFHVNSTRQGLWVQVPNLKAADSFMNRWGVSIVSDKCSSREDRKDLTDGGVLFELRYKVFMEARSARGAVLLAGKLVQTKGYSDSGRSYIIADSREAWVLSVVRGRHWVAQRVPDDEVMLIPNYYTIGTVDLSDKKNFLASPGLIEYALERGWYDPEVDGEFSFRDAYALPSTLTSDHNTRRHELALAAIGLGYSSDNVPFSVRTASKIGVGDVERMLKPVQVESTICSEVFLMDRRKPVLWFRPDLEQDYSARTIDGSGSKETIRMKNPLVKAKPAGGQPSGAGSTSEPPVGKQALRPASEANTESPRGVRP